jgi:hypothetical protein
MAKKRQPIDELIDALVWMRRREIRLNGRPLTLDDVPDELLAECGQRRIALAPHTVSTTAEY